MEHPRFLYTRPRRWGLAVLIGILASILLAMTVFAAKAAIQPTDKQIQVEQKLAAQQTAAANSTRAPKPTQPAADAATQPSSCPLPPGEQTGILPRSNVDPALARDVQFMNGASIAPGPSRLFEYVIGAGAYRANPQQGVFVVERRDPDPCAPGATGTQFNRYNTPFQQGTVTITQIIGDTVTFTTAAGGSGTFNYVTGKFS